MGKLFTIVLIIFSISQSISATGNRIFVFDKETNKPLVKANIHFKCISENCKGKTATAKTGKDGSILIPFNGKLQIIVSYVGYKSVYKTIESGQIYKYYLKPSAIMMNEVVTTGQFTPKSSQRSIFPVKVITREKIESQAASNLADLMSNELNISLSQDNLLGSSLSINGVSGQNVKIMVDGIPIIGRLNGNVDISQINLNNIERVEIIEGPMSVTYGSDALGGVINLITKKDRNKDLSGTVNSYYESVGKYNVDADVSFSTDHYIFSLTGGRNFFSGFSELDTTRSKSWKPREQYFADLNITRRVKDMNIRYTGRFFDDFILNRGNLRPPYFETAFDDHYKTRRWTNALQLNTALWEDKYIDATVSYSSYRRLKNSYIKDMVNLVENITTPENQDTTTFGEFLFRTTFSSDRQASFISYQTGIDIHLDNVAGGRIADNSKTMNDYAFFTSIQFDWTDNILIQPAIRVISNSEYDAPLIPSLNLKAEIIDDLILRASFAKGFRAPTLRELYMYFFDINHNLQGNSDLKAETSKTYTVSLDYSHSFDRSVLKTDVKFFYNDISNYIDYAASDSLGLMFSYQNISQYQSLGANYSVSYITEDFLIRGGGALTGRKSAFSLSIGRDEFLFTPEIQGQITYDLDALDMKLSAFYKYTGVRPVYAIIDEELFEMEYDAYNMLEASVSKRFYDDFLTLTIGGKNLFDVVNIKRNLRDNSEMIQNNYESPIAIGRTFFASIKINL